MGIGENMTRKKDDTRKGKWIKAGRYQTKGRANNVVANKKKRSKYPKENVYMIRKVAKRNRKGKRFGTQWQVYEKQNYNELNKRLAASKKKKR